MLSENPVDQALTLTRRSPHSFDCVSISSFTGWLADHGFRQIARSRSLVEHSRWERSQRLVIVYHSGAIVVQGVQPAPAIKLLETLLIEQQALELAVI